MNIIFLDIDGVLNSEMFFCERNEKLKNQRDTILKPISSIDPKAVALLNDVCKETEAKVVISSTWRHSGLNYMRNVLAEAGATFEIIDITPDYRQEWAVRGNEIKGWIEENFEPNWPKFESYVILDDDNDMLLEQNDNFIQTDSFWGLREHECMIIKNLFNCVLNKA